MVQSVIEELFEVNSIFVVVIGKRKMQNRMACDRLSLCTCFAPVPTSIWKNAPSRPRKTQALTTPMLRLAQQSALFGEINTHGLGSALQCQTTQRTGNLKNVEKRHETN